MLHNHAKHAHTPELEGIPSVLARWSLLIYALSHFLEQAAAATCSSQRGCFWFSREQPPPTCFHLSRQRFTIDDSDWPQAALGTKVERSPKTCDQAGLKGRLEAFLADD